MKHGKKYVESAKLVDRNKLYDCDEALDTVIKAASAKFDETVEAHIRLGVDSRQDRKSTRLNSSHTDSSRMPSSA